MLVLYSVYLVKQKYIFMQNQKYKFWTIEELWTKANNN
jgi:hypothetical protein